MHHYRNDETDVFFAGATPTTSKSERPHLVIDNVNGRVWLNLGGAAAGAAATFYLNGGTAASMVETLTTARTLTAADNNKIFFLNAAGGFTVQLPSVAAGLHFKFIAKTNPTTAYIILAEAVADHDTIIGWPLNCGGADSVADGNALGDQLNFAANVALAGDMAEFWCDGAFWYVQANAKAINAITITG